MTSATVFLITATVCLTSVYFSERRAARAEKKLELYRSAAKKALPYLDQIWSKKIEEVR